MSNNSSLKKVLIFDINGSMAHFRKFDANSSSMSYIIPPRTVTVGLIAAMLGMPSERHTTNMEDTYYEKLDEKNCFVTVSLKSEVGRIMQTLNYPYTEQTNNITFSKHSRIPTEILVSKERGKPITYRIYFYHNDEKIYNEMKERLENDRYECPIYFGGCDYRATIKYVGEGKTSKNTDKTVNLHSVCRSCEAFPTTCLDAYQIETMPTGFTLKKINGILKRFPKKTYMYLLNNKVTSVNVNDDAACYSVSYKKDGCNVVENIMKM